LGRQVASERIVSREQALYGAEALVILAALPFGVLATLAAAFPVIFVIGALPAIGLGIVGFVRPGYFAPVGLTDPRRGVRRYVHIYAAISLLPVFLSVLGLLSYALQR
jgi:hypothetical protein